MNEKPQQPMDSAQQHPQMPPLAPPASTPAEAAPITSAVVEQGITLEQQPKPDAEIRQQEHRYSDRDRWILLGQDGPTVLQEGRPTMEGMAEQHPPLPTPLMTDFSSPQPESTDKQELEEEMAKELLADATAPKRKIAGKMIAICGGMLVVVLLLFGAGNVLFWAGFEAEAGVTPPSEEEITVPEESINNIKPSVQPSETTEEAPPTQTEEETQTATTVANTFDIHQLPQATADGTMPTPLTTEELYAKHSDAIVGVLSYATEQDRQFGYAAGVGSGIVMRADGYIITNAHLVKDVYTSEELLFTQVVLPDDVVVDATLVGYDPTSDIALLKVDGQPPLQAGVFGDADQIAIGQPAIAIGNPRGLSFAKSVSEGIISGLDRSLTLQDGNTHMSLIQTDAALSSGSSGGALFNEYGQIIGVVAMKITAESAEGMGFAVPINTAQTVVEQLLTKGYVGSNAQIGITYRDITPEFALTTGVPAGMRIATVDPTAECYGILLEGDIILAMEGIPTTDMEAVDAMLYEATPDDMLSMDIYRMVEGEEQYLTLDVPLSPKPQT